MRYVTLPKIYLNGLSLYLFSCSAKSNRCPLYLLINPSTEVMDSVLETDESPIALLREAVFGSFEDVKIAGSEIHLSLFAPISSRWKDSSPLIALL